MSAAKNENPAELDQYLTRHPETQSLELLQPDMVGILRGKRVGRGDFAKAFRSGVNFCGATVLLDSQGQTFEGIDNGGRDGDPDVISWAVSGSLARVPWAHVPSAQVLLAMFDEQGEPYFADPRQVLRRAARPLADLGLTAVAATELEFYLVQGEEDRPQPYAPSMPGTRTRQVGPQYGSMDDIEQVDPFIAELHAVCEAQNIPIGATLKEFSPGQFEVNLHHVADAELACDHGVLLKRAVRAIAKKHGLGAAFMAKPFAEWAGCSLHVHVSLLDADGRNAFASTERRDGVSNTLRHAVGGLGATMAEAMAIFAPNANSYRRFRPGLFVPLAPNWGVNHRGVALRIPLSGPEDRRIEHRPAGADANPYLVMAAVLAGIHHGITHRSDPGPMVEQSELIEERTLLPVRWEAALDAFEAGKVLPQYLGERYCALYAACRREECDRFHAQITDRDYEWYLRGA